MKAISILLWICRESFSGEDLIITDVPEQGAEEWEQNEGWWQHQIGAVPERMAPAGKYLTIHEGRYFDNEDSYMYDDDYKRVEPDVTLTFEDDGKHVWLYRIDEGLSLSDSERSSLKGVLHATYKTFRRYSGMNIGRSEIHNLYREDIDNIINIHDRL